MGENILYVGQALEAQNFGNGQKGTTCKYIKHKGMMHVTKHIQNFQKVIASTRSKTHAYICCRFGKQNKEKYLKKEKRGNTLL